MAAETEGIIREGKAIVRHEGTGVFYNKVQVFNRDVSVLMLRMFQAARAEERKEAAAKKAAKAAQKPPKPAKRAAAAEDGDQEEEDGAGEEEVLPADLDSINILEALSATGLRSVRYFKEVPHVRNIIANDLLPAAVEAIRANVVTNGLTEAQVTPNMGDANLVMYQACANKQRFDVVDLDPYGSAAPFLNAALQAVADGGLLCVTCTDMAVLSGNHPETCFAKYGVMPLHTKYCHEMALRVVLASIERTANLYKKYIVPVMSLSIDFYVRVFVRVHTSALEGKRAAAKQAYVYHCIGCEAHHLQPVGKVTKTERGEKYAPALGPPVDQLCELCGSKFRMGGPIWANPIHDTAIIRRALDHVAANTADFATHERITGMLTVAAEELNDVPLYYDLATLSKIIHVSQPPLMNFRSALIAAGYQVSSTHCMPLGIKTNAPAHVIWDIMRGWVKDHPIKDLSETSPGFAIMSKEPAFAADFTILDAANPESRRVGLARFAPNPEENWGPKARATGKRSASDAGLDPTEVLAARSAANQGKRTKRTKLCQYFKEGRCKRGDKCNYSHDTTLLEAGESAAAAAEPDDQDRMEE